MSEDIGNGLDDLLDDLDGVSKTTPPPAIEPEIVDSSELIIHDENEIVDMSNMLDDPAPDQSNSGMLDVKKFLKEHDEDYYKARDNVHSDRTQVQHVINNLMEKMEEGDVRAATVESLVSAVKCLVDSNGHLARLLDSRTRVLSALKPSGPVVQNNIDANNADLTAILSQPIDNV